MEQVVEGPRPGTFQSWKPRTPSHSAADWRVRRIHALSVERDCAESQLQQHLRLAVTPNLLRLVLRTQPRSGLPAKFTDNLWMPWAREWRMDLLAGSGGMVLGCVLRVVLTGPMVR